MRCWFCSRRAGFVRQRTGREGLFVQSYVISESGRAKRSVVVSFGLEVIVIAGAYIVGD